MSNNSSPLAFSIANNVRVTVMDKFGNIRKEVETHNKCSRNMVIGILRYLCGHFTGTNANDNPPYETAKEYIPCYFGVGDGGVVLYEVEEGTFIPKSKDGLPTIPELEDDWTYHVNYTDTELTREFFVVGNATSNSRTKIQDIKTSILQPPLVDMDSIYLYCQIPPGKLNEFYTGHNVFVTELGLFSNNVCGKNDLLAKVKLTNYQDENEDWKTDALFVRPEDTVVVRWILSIAAVGVDSRFEAQFEDEYGQQIRTTIQAIPNAGNITVLTEENG